MLQSLLLAALVSAAPQVELVQFTAKWCGPCQQMYPVITEVQSAGFKVHLVDVDEHADLAGKYHVQRVPTSVIQINGRVVDRLEGVVDANQLMMRLRRAVSHQGAPSQSPTASAKSASNRHRSTSASNAASNSPAMSHATNSHLTGAGKTPPNRNHRLPRPGLGLRRNR